MMQRQEFEVNPAVLCREKLVSELDLGRYAGRWYEIAKSKLAWIAWESECGDVTADYTVNRCNGLDVVNSCYNNGRLLRASEATGKVVYPEYPGALHLVFKDSDAKPGHGWYFVVDTDYNSYAIVGSPGKKFMWILGRTPKMSEAKIRMAIRKLQAAGYKPRDPEWGLVIDPKVIV